MNTYFLIYREVVSVRNSAKLSVILAEITPKLGAISAIFVRIPAIIGRKNVNFFNFCEISPNPAFFRRKKQEEQRSSDLNGCSDQAINENKLNVPTLEMQFFQCAQATNGNFAVQLAFTQDNPPHH